MRHPEIGQIEEACAADDQLGIKEHAALIFSSGVTEEKGGVGVDHQPHYGQDVGVDARERQHAHDRVEQPPTDPADHTGPSHCAFASGASSASSWIVDSAKISSSRFPLGDTTTTLSPTFLLSRARPIGEVVEIFPDATSASSLVTSLYSISSSLVPS